MIYISMPVIIPVLAAGYLLTIYLLLILAQRTIKTSPYVDSSLKDAYTPYVSKCETPQTNEGEGWSLQVSGAASVSSEELSSSVATPPKVKGASSIS